MQQSKSINKTNQSITSIKQLPSVLQDQYELNSLEKIDEYIQILQRYEQQCIDEGQLQLAQQSLERIAELKHYKKVFLSLKTYERNQSQIQQLENQYQIYMTEFNLKWDKVIEDQNFQNLQQLNELDKIHKIQKESLLNEISQAEIPKTKFTKELLFMYQHFETLMKAKNFGDAHNLKQKIIKMEEEENQKWEQLHRKKLHTKVDHLEARQITEKKQTQDRLKLSLQLKLKHRDDELNILKRKLQNGMNELISKQNLEISKLNIMNSKELSKQGF